MHDEVGRQRQPRGQQHRRPVHGVETQHSLAQQVNPAFRGAPGLFAGRGDVVAERVPPDVDHLARVARHRDAPATGAFRRAGHRDVVEPAGEEREHLVAALGGLDAQPPGLDGLAQRCGIARQPEEPVLFGDPLGWRVVLRAAAAGELGLGVELLAAHAVAALVAAAVEVVRAGVPEPLDACAVARVAAGVQHVVEVEVVGLVQRGEGSGVAVDELGCRGACRLGGDDVLERVVVGAGLEPDGRAAPPVVAGEHVGLHELEQEADVRPGVDVGDGRGDQHRNLHSGAPVAQAPRSRGWREEDVVQRPRRAAINRNVVMNRG